MMIFNHSVYFALACTILSTANGMPQNMDQKHHVHKRASVESCPFPKDAGLVSVTPNGKNAGWAIHSDVACTPGNYCPYVCPPGKLMAQWDPQATSYTYPQSQYGGLKCNEDGTVSKPFSNKDYCVDGKGTLKVDNKAGSNVAFCQTVLPGNEEMLIPTDVGTNGLTTLAVPGTDYWASTAAHYYINPPGVSTSEGCVWGSTANPYGNWSPYVAGVNMDDNKNTYVKIGWNPKYLDDFSSKTPNFGIRITCDDESKCNGLKCEIDPSKGVGKVEGPQVSNGAGNAQYCVVTAEQSSTAKIEVFSVNGSSNKKREIEPREISQLFNGAVSKGVNSSNNSNNTPEVVSTSGSSAIKGNTLISVATTLSVFSASTLL